MPESARRNAFIGVIISWGLAFVATLLVGLLVDQGERAPWLVIAFAVVVVLSFAIQLWYANPVGFIFRVSASVGGALVVIGLISAVFSMVAMLRG